VAVKEIPDVGAKNPLRKYLFSILPYEFTVRSNHAFEGVDDGLLLKLICQVLFEAF
jgi:hypothetical protein